jgi:hypothetical protein
MMAYRYNLAARRLFRSAVAVAAVAVAAAGGPVAAQQAGPTAANTAAEARSIWTIQGENDTVSTTPEGSDKYYTSGLRLGWTSGVGQVPDFASRLGTAVWGDGTTRISFDINQQIFTPFNTERINPNPRDRPVAAYLGGTFSVIQDTGNSRGVLAFTLGVIGPLALGRQVQNGFHELIHERINKGWGGQLPNEPAVQVVAEKTWRVPVLAVAGLETDLLPSATIGLGTVRNYAQAGMIFRVGQGLSNDFGVTRIRPGLTGGDAFGGREELTWYIFAGANGQAVVRDAFLSGAIFQRSAHVQHNWLMGEMQAGGAVLWHGVRLSYTQTWQTKSFKGQRRGLFNFGSLTASVRF